MFGRYNTLKDGSKDWRAVIKWYAAIATLWLWDKLSPRRRNASPRLRHAARTRCSRARRRGASSCSCHKRSCTT
jgi:hypothetical protein